ncbi:MAG: type IV pilus inner membrane component PilO [Planctomycetota bacterium]|jgi:Tfp pilus assembly protein PilO
MLAIDLGFESRSYLMLLRDKQQLLICIFAGAMLGGFVLFRYLPLRQKIKAVEQERAAQNAAATMTIAGYKQLPLLKEHLEELRKTVGSYETKVPAQRNLGVFLHGIAGLMNEHNLKGQVVQPGQEMRTAGLNCIPVSMKCKGRLEHIFKFFGSLQALDRLIRIEQVELLNDNDFSGEVSMNTEAVIYYAAGPEQG